MKIMVCGLGYVGVTTAACLVNDGHHVVGVDVNDSKVADVASGISPVSEPGVNELLARGVAENRLEASTSIEANLSGTDVVLVCVGTPSHPSGSLDLSFVRSVTREIGLAISKLEESAERPLIVYRSTLPPGTMESVISPILLDLAGEPGADYDLAFNPEFLRESSAIADYYAPAKIVIGEAKPGASQQLRGLYSGIEAPVFELPFSTAEMIKLTDNSFHAIKVAFGNEIGRIALSLSVNPQQVIDAFLVDTRLNISPAYFRPGGPFGGSCLPKDLRAIRAFAESQGVDIPLISSTLQSNASHKSYLAQLVFGKVTPGSKILLLGLSFKSDTDDLRESPLVDLAETLLGKGYDLKIIDPDLQGRTLIGANSQYVDDHLPHLSRLLVNSLHEAGEPDLVIIGKQMDSVVQSLDSEMATLNLTRL